MKEPVDFAADAAAVAGISSDDALKTVATLADESVTLAMQIATIEESVKLLAERKRMVDESLLPDAMDAAKLKTFTTTSGAVVEVGPFLAVSLAGEKMANAIGWLKETNNDGLISKDVALSFKKGQDADAQKSVDLLIAAGFAPAVKEAVNTATFKALLKELLQKGVAVPLEKLGAYSARKATIKTKK